VRNQEDIPSYIYQCDAEIYPQEYSLPLTGYQDIDKTQGNKMKQEYSQRDTESLNRVVYMSYWL
jgi:hypothetical protein